MTSLFGKMLLMQNTRALVQALSLMRAPLLKQQIPLGFLYSWDRPFRSMPTQGIGRYKYLLPKEIKKKKGKAQAKKIKAATSTEYSVLNVEVIGYDMTLVEHYSQYIHNLCFHLDIRVNESFGTQLLKTWKQLQQDDMPTFVYVLADFFALGGFLLGYNTDMLGGSAAPVQTQNYAMPTKSTEVMVMPEQGTKMYLDAVLKTHERVVQISQLKASLVPIFMDVILKNQPEGVQLSIREHTEEEHLKRYKSRRELETILAQISSSDN